MRFVIDCYPLLAFSPILPILFRFVLSALEFSFSEVLASCTILHRLPAFAFLLQYVRLLSTLFAFSVVVYTECIMQVKKYSSEYKAVLEKIKPLRIFLR